ncbi:MAG: hypothetical protein ACI9JL_004241 [Paracoccaceae bacterium]|jgi:hypothetical protein
MAHDATPDTSLIFDKAAIQVILDRTSLPLVGKETPYSLQEALNQIAGEHYWNELKPAEHSHTSGAFTFDSVANASVTPSRLRDRLVAVQKSATRVYAGTSRKPVREKLEELLERLGRDKDGSPLKHSGTELPGHGNSERGAIWLCLVRAVLTMEVPPWSWKSTIGARPWYSQKLEGVIQELARGIASEIEDQQNAIAAARTIEGWARWCIKNVERLTAADNDRRRGNTPLGTTLLELGALYARAFDATPSFYIGRPERTANTTEPWEQFLHATLERILQPRPVPTFDALAARWHRLEKQQ